jgi:hypothetical protein
MQGSLALSLRRLRSDGSLERGKIHFRTFRGETRSSSCAVEIWKDIISRRGLTKISRGETQSFITELVAKFEVKKRSETVQKNKKVF